jgi:hypothetical protein
MALPLMVLLLFLLDAINPLSASVERCHATAGLPSRPITHRPSFRWSAGVDRSSGTASSKEVSNLCIRFGKSERSSSRTKVCNTAGSLFASYPEWLCSGKVTLGLFQAVPLGQDSGCSIQTRLLPISLLEFGAPRVTTYILPGDRFAACEIPIVGGLLSHINPKSKERGHLFFGLKKMIASETDSRKASHNHHVTKINIETRIVKYTPAIGGLPPVTRLREWLYLNTQGLVHANVMWRFHGHCRSIFWQATILPSFKLITKSQDKR